ncbi:MAG: hypothetical protein KC646_08375 [Candidatus Cloacimonetes bacterium]|nr:hypothetical protein [Candidatus Cloacimonadota bacterium]
MIRFLLLASLFFNSSASFAEEEFFGDLNQDVSPKVEVKKESKAISNEKDYIAQLNKIFKKEVQHNIKDRHILTAKLNSCIPSKKDSALIIAFEGTGAYEPYIPALMERARIQLRDKVSAGVFSDTLDHAITVFKGQTGKDPKWSGLQNGVMEALYEDPNLLDGNFNWYSYPSEEAEVLAGLDGISGKNILRLARDMGNSIASFPLGIQGAISCTKKFISRAKSLEYYPTVIVVTHSSGGRSSVKFAEHLKKQKYISLDGKTKTGINIDLVMTIDPVKEAHEALKEAALQISGHATKNAVNFFLPKGSEIDNPDARVWSRHQPSSLYNPSNVDRFVSVYQTEDELGLKVGLKFGIWGSPIADVDEEIKIKSGLGESGHGEIAYHEKTINLFKKEINKLK